MIHHQVGRPIFQAASLGTAAAFALAVQDIDRHGVVGLQGANHLFDAFFPASSVMNTNQDKGLILVLFGQLNILG